MSICVRWVGLDFGQCLMDPSGLRNHLVIGDVCKWMYQPELTDECIHNYRRLKEKYGSYGAIKEAHRDEILTYVFNGDPRAEEIFSIKEQEFLKPAEGAKEILNYLRSEGIEIAVVAELKKTLGPIGTDIVTRFLQRNELIEYFDALISPQGKRDLRSDRLDLRYKGKTKEEGTLYDELVSDLGAKGIRPSEAVMIGDKPSTDIRPAKQRGFWTVQYVGYVDMGPSGADFVIKEFRELKKIIKGVKV